MCSLNILQAADWIVPDLKWMVLPTVPLAPLARINMQTAFLRVSKEKQKVQINRMNFLLSGKWVSEK